MTSRTIIVVELREQGLSQVKEQECEIEREAASRVTSLNPAASFYIKRNRGAAAGSQEDPAHSG